MADNTGSGIVVLGEAIRDTLDNVIRQIVDYSPEVIGAVLVLLVGWLVAKTLSLSTQKLVQSLDSLFARFWRSDPSQRDKIQRSYTKIFSKAVFWIVLVFFLAVASNILGWDMFSGWMQQAFSYVPSIITGVFIIVGGFILGSFTRSAVITTAEKSGIQQRVVIAKLVQVAIIFCAILIGVDQIGLNINFLSNIVVTVIGVALAGAALAFGLGAKDLSANVIGARYLHRHCEAGDHVTIAGIEGEIIEISQASIILRTEQGRAIIPAEVFHREVTIVHSDNQ